MDGAGGVRIVGDERVAPDDVIDGVGAQHLLDAEARGRDVGSRRSRRTRSVVCVIENRAAEILGLSHDWRAGGANQGDPHLTGDLVHRLATNLNAEDVVATMLIRSLLLRW